MLGYLLIPPQQGSKVIGVYVGYTLVLYIKCVLVMFFHLDKMTETLLSPRFPEALHGKAAGRAAVMGRGGPPDPLGDLNCFNHGPM